MTKRSLLLMQRPCSDTDTHQEELEERQLEEEAAEALSTAKDRLSSPVLRHLLLPSSEYAPIAFLSDVDLWNKFAAVGNEMIITKNGRCLFPILKFGFCQMHPNVSYSIGLDFILVSPSKFKYRSSIGKWVPVSTGPIHPQNDGFQLPTPMYNHPEGPSSGSYWMERGASFATVKITNRPAVTQSRSPKGQIQNVSPVFSLASFHMYVPRLHLYPMHVSCPTADLVYVFDQTRFIAVTHYQNNAVNLLKKNYNPHAKGFKESFQPLEMSSSPRVSRMGRTSSDERDDLPQSSNLFPAVSLPASPKSQKEDSEEECEY